MTKKHNLLVNEEVEEVFWFSQPRCNRKVIANVIILMITWGM